MNLLFRFSVIRESVRGVSRLTDHQAVVDAIAVLRVMTRSRPELSTRRYLARHFQYKSHMQTDGID